MSVRWQSGSDLHVPRVPGEDAKHGRHSEFGKVAFLLSSERMDRRADSTGSGELSAAPLVLSNWKELTPLLLLQSHTYKHTHTHRNQFPPPNASTPSPLVHTHSHTHASFGMAPCRAFCWSPPPAYEQIYLIRIFHAPLQMGNITVLI